MSSKEQNWEIQYKVFEWLRFPLIVGVVFIHCFGKHFDYDSIDFCHLTGMDFYNLFRICISHVLAHVSVPVFFFISGYLFFKGLESWNYKEYKEKLKRRIKSLLIPFLIWNTISIFLAIIGKFENEGWIGVYRFLDSNGFMHLYWDIKNLSVGQTNWLGGEILLTSPYLVPLWYIRDLIIVILCSPLLYYYFRKTNVYGLLLLFICYVSGLFIYISGFSSMAFFFYGTGAYCKMNDINPTIIAEKYRKSVAILTLLLIVILTVFNGCFTKTGNLIYPWYVILGCINVVNIATYMVKRNLIMPTLLSSSAFFIYLSHKVVIINVLTKMSEKIFGLTNPLYMTISYLTVPILSVFICLLIFYIFNRFTPRLCSFLIGGR